MKTKDCTAMKTIRDIDTMTDEEFLSFWHEIESERIPGAEVPADDVIKYFEANPLPEEVGA